MKIPITRDTSNQVLKQEQEIKPAPEENNDSHGLKSSMKSLKQSFRRLVKPIVVKRKESTIAMERKISKEEETEINKNDGCKKVDDSKSKEDNIETVADGCKTKTTRGKIRTISIHYADVDEVFDQEIAEVLSAEVMTQADTKKDGENLKAVQKDPNVKQERQSSWKKIFTSSAR